ncbi:MAG: segregation/condensation protein A, partial [Anaerolineales bacterium]|nr:segregation/condensation protein A [Anaerolineales bacterium]
MKTAAYPLDLPSFSGPLDLLLHLIERQELDITRISLAQVTSQYLAQLEHLKASRLEHLIDFIVIGARLALIKSRALLPQTPLQVAEDDEEDPAEALLRQLREYRRFKQAANWLKTREAHGLRTHLRVAPPPRLEKRLDLSGVTLQSLMLAVQAVLARAETLEESVSLVQPRQITIEGQIKKLRTRLGEKRPFFFHELFSAHATRTEIAVTLLATLELIKREEVRATQQVLFGPIEIAGTGKRAAVAATTTPSHARNGS